MSKIKHLTIDEMYDLLYSPGNLTAQTIACSCCGGSHALADCPEDREEWELLDSVDYFGFIKPLRFE